LIGESRLSFLTSFSSLIFCFIFLLISGKWYKLRIVIFMIAGYLNWTKLVFKFVCLFCWLFLWMIEVAHFQIFAFLFLFFSNRCVVNWRIYCRISHATAPNHVHHYLSRIRFVHFVMSIKFIYTWLILILRLHSFNFLLYLKAFGEPLTLIYTP
jgi:hypothetical protein